MVPATAMANIVFTMIQIHHIRNAAMATEAVNMIAFHTASLIRRRITLPLSARKNKGRVPKDPTPYFKIFAATSAFLQIRA